MEDPNFATPVHKVHLEIAIERTLAVPPYATVWRKGMRLQILKNEQNGGHKPHLFESNCSYISQSGHEPFARNIFLRY